ncbi:uncharacterized protein LOC126482361 isoform X2 [Schistocerca serialis cubense]|uniref:uncharacterized protein LOC126482361 isoform X2 n=1 Tax=Schistocerca serialis cubense TaxID=2023355 RepID=UPI00214E18E9|nr:uncharacterized protein LOC126482361 isoform X2 [Schistocerca serialis cubense]
MAFERTAWLLTAVFLLAAVACALSQERQDGEEKSRPTTIRPRLPPPRQQRDVPPPGGREPASTPRPATIRPRPPVQRPGP